MFTPPPPESLVDESEPVASQGFTPPPPESLVEESDDRALKFVPPPPESIVEEAAPLVPAEFPKDVSGVPSGDVPIILDKALKKAKIPAPSSDEIASLRTRVNKLTPEWDYSGWQEQSAMSDFGPPMIPPRKALLKQSTPENIRKAELTELADNYLQLAEAAPTFVGGLMRSVSGEGGFNKAYPFIGAISSAAQKSLRNGLLEKMRSKQPLDETEQAAVEAMALAERRIEQPQKFWEQVGSITGTSIPYALEFGMTGGAFTAAKGASEIALKNAPKAVRYVASRLAGVGAQSAISSVPRISDEYLDRVAPQWKVEPKQLRATIEDVQADKDWLVELTKATGSSFIENLSERTGSIVGRAIPKQTIAKLLRLGAIKTWLDKAGAQSVREAADAAKKAMAFNGIVEEVAEEYIGNGLKALTGVDDQHNVLASLAKGDVAEALSKFVESFPIEETPAMAVSFGFVPAGLRAAELGAGAVEKVGKYVRERPLRRAIDEELGTEEARARARAMRFLTPEQRAAVERGDYAATTESDETSVPGQRPGVTPVGKAGSVPGPGNRVPSPTRKPAAAGAVTPPVVQKPKKPPVSDDYLNNWISALDPDQRVRYDAKTPEEKAAVRDRLAQNPRPEFMTAAERRSAFGEDWKSESDGDGRDEPWQLSDSERAKKEDEMLDVLDNKKPGDKQEARQWMDALETGSNTKADAQRKLYQEKWAKEAAEAQARYEEAKRRFGIGKPVRQDTDALVKQAIAEARKNGPSPEFRAFFGGIDPTVAGTTPEKVKVFANGLGMVWNPVTGYSPEPVVPVKAKPAVILKPDMASARLIIDMTPEEFMASVNASGKFFNKINHPLADGATPKDVTELKGLLAKAKARSEAAKAKAYAPGATDQDKQDYSAITSIEQFYNETVNRAEERLNVAPTFPERPETIAHQLQMLQDGKRKVVQITEGETIPEIPKGFSARPVPGNGVFIYQPARVNVTHIVQAVREDRIGDILGYGISRKPAKGTEIGAWVVRDRDGVEKHGVLTDEAHSAAVEKAARTMMSPGDTISLEPEAEVIARRKGPIVKKAAAVAETPKSSTQLTLPAGEAMPFISFGALIPDSSIYFKKDASGKEDYGRETEPHITVLYGLTSHLAVPVEKIVSAKNPITVTLGKTSVFEGKDYDVLKVDVSGKDLHDLNSAISKLPNEQTHPEYKPHLTIAYLKKGEGKKYIGDTRFEGKKLTFNSVTFSPPSELRAAIGKPELLFKPVPTTPSKSRETVSVIIRVKSHRARDKMQRAIGDIGTNLMPADLGPGEFYAVTPSEFVKLKGIKGIAKSSRPVSELRPASFGGEGFDEKQKEAQRRLIEAMELSEFEIAQLGRLRLMRDQGREMTAAQKKTLNLLEDRVPSEAHAIAAGRAQLETVGQPAVAQASLGDESLGDANRRARTGENPAESFLRGNVSADPSLAQGSDGRRRQAEILAKWAAENDAILTAAPSSYGSQLEHRTSEHYVVGDPAGQRVIKWTWPGTFGHTPIQKELGVGREPSSPLQYLQRIRLQNSIFGDDISVLGFQVFPDKGLMGRPGGLAIVTSQPFIKAADTKNPNPTRDELWDYMEAHGFEADAYGGEMGAWSRSDGVMVTDVRADNFVKTAKGLVPIDLQISKPNETQADIGSPAPVEEPKPVQKAHSVEDLLALLPHAGLSPQAEALMREMLKMPVIAQLPQFTTVIADLLDSGFQGSQLGTLIELARNADPLTGPHELLHLVWDHLMPLDFKAEFERLRVASLDKLIEEATAEGKEETVKALTDIRDNPTTGGVEFLSRAYPVALRAALYPYSSAEEFFTHSGSTQFKQKVGSMVEGFWAKVKAIIGDFIRAIKRALKLRRNQEEMMDDILAGRFEPAKAEDAARGERERQGSLTPEEQREAQLEIAEQDQGGKVPTRVFGEEFYVVDRERITPESIAASSDLAKQMLDTAGIPAVEQDVPQDDPWEVRRGWIMQPQGHDMTPQGRVLLDSLRRELSTQTVATKTADRLANIINSVRLNFVMGKASAMGDMASDVRLELFSIAQSEASYRGAALGALAGYKKDLVFIGRNLDVELGRIWSDAFGGDNLRDILDELEEAKKRGDDLQATLDKLLKKRSSKLKKTQGRSSRLNQKILDMVQSADPSVLALLKDMAAARGWKIPTDDDFARMKLWADELDRLQELTDAEKAAAGTSEDAIKLAQHEKIAVTDARQANLRHQIETLWHRFTTPLTVRTETGRANIVQAVGEYISANLLLKIGFGTRQMVDIITQGALHTPTRAVAHALEVHQGEVDAGTRNASDVVALWGDIGDALTQAYAQRTAAIRSTLSATIGVMAGTEQGRNVARLLERVGLFDRAMQKADEMKLAGRNVEAGLLKLFTFMRMGYRIAQALDNLHGLPAVYQEMRQQVVAQMRSEGLTRAEAQTKADWVMGDMKAEWMRAIPDAQVWLEQNGIEFDDRALKAAAWRLVTARQYERMRTLKLPVDDFEERNRVLLNTIGWNLPEKGGPGGFIADVMSKGNRMARQMASAPLPLSVPMSPVILGLVAATRFGNAIGVLINRKLSFTPLGFAPGAFGVDEREVGEDGLARGGSPWYRSEQDRRQRKVEASVGTMFGAALLALVLSGAIIVRLKWPKDKEERQLWDKMGWKPGQVSIPSGPDSHITLSMNTGPLVVAAPALAMGGAIRDLIDDRAKKQAKLNAVAEAKGLTPGKIRPVDASDMLGVGASAAWGAVISGRTLSGLVGSFTDYGGFNPVKTSASILSAVTPTLPAMQEVSRMAGVTLDAQMATVWDFLLPLPTSKAAQVNLLGDRVGSANDVQRVVQVLTGGNFPFPVNDKERQAGAGYEVLFATGYRPPSIDPNRGYSINGEWRPLNDKELSAYTQTRGTLLKQELADLGPDATLKGAQQAYQRANRQALADIGVDVPSRTGGGSGVAAQGAAQAGAPAGVSLRRGRSTARLGAVRGPSLSRPSMGVPGARRVSARRSFRPSKPKRLPSLKVGRGLSLPKPKYGRVPSLRRR